MARSHLACDVADDGIGPIDEPPSARVLLCEALECRDRPVRSRDDAHAVQVDLGEPPERIAAMCEPVPQRCAVHARVAQVFDPLIGRDVGALGRLGVAQAVDGDRPSTRRGFNLEGAHRAPAGAPAPRDA